jgi:uncharacterized membrane protein HdeD (DUF308 family)
MSKRHLEGREGMSEGPTWQLLASMLSAITGILLVPAAFSPDNPAPLLAILGMAAIMVGLSLLFLKLHIDFRRGQRRGR